jgi:predicted RNA-binding protein with PIN domain
MEYWVDGYNLILRKGWEKSGGLEQARLRLLRLAVPLGAPVRVYFDARRGEGRSRDESPSTRVRPVYVTAGAADDAMASDLRGAPKGQVTVVTDDRELRGRAKQLGAVTLGVEKFLERLDHANAPVREPSPASRTPALDERVRFAPETRDVRLSRREVDEWMKIFGLEDPPPDAPR